MAMVASTSIAYHKPRFAVVFKVVEITPPPPPRCLGVRCFPTDYLNLKFKETRHSDMYFPQGPNLKSSFRIRAKARPQVGSSLTASQAAQHRGQANTGRMLRAVPAVWPPQIPASSVRRRRPGGAIRCAPGGDGGSSPPEVAKAKLEVGSPIVIVEAPLTLKTAASMPSLRHNAGQVKAGDVGRIMARKPKDVWAVRLAVGTYLLDGKHFEPLDVADDDDGDESMDK